MDTHKQHHYVPRFLLRGWQSGGDGKLSQMRWILDNRGVPRKMAEKRYKAESVAKIQHLYSMKRQSTQPNQEIEPKFMSKLIDDPAAIVHRLLVSGGVGAISEDQKYDWTQFLVSLVFRVPGAIEHLRESSIDALDSQFPDDFLENPAGQSDSLKKLHALFSRRAPALLDFGTYKLPELIETSSYNKLFFEADWSVRRFVGNARKLLIGDRPLILFGPKEELDLIYLPLAPDVAFFSSRAERMTQRINSTGDSRLVMKLNRGTVEQASVYVWGGDFENRRLLERYLPHMSAGRGMGIGPRSGRPSSFL